MLAPGGAFPEGIMSIYDATSEAYPSCFEPFRPPLRLLRLEQLLCRLDLDKPWDLNNYFALAVSDAVRAVASAVDRIIKGCLGDPISPALIARTLQTSVVEDSAMRIGNDTLSISVDKGRRFV